MPPPVTPIVGVDTFVVNAKKEVCLIRRSDDALWALPGGAQELGETPEECARREFEEETGHQVRIIRLLGIFSSLRYDAVTNVNRSREVTHILFAGEIVGGQQETSVETPEIGWFSQEDLPALSDGHAPRIEFGFQSLENPQESAHFE